MKDYSNYSMNNNNPDGLSYNCKSCNTDLWNQSKQNVKIQYQKKSVQFRLIEISNIETQLFQELEVYQAMPEHSHNRIEQAVKIDKLKESYCPYNALMYA